jgi:hypothetical protein
MGSEQGVARKVHALWTGVSENALRWFIAMGTDTVLPTRGCPLLRTGTTLRWWVRFLTRRGVDPEGGARDYCLSYLLSNLLHVLH